MLIITDIDGTIADDRHRHQHLKAEDLVSFFESSDKDNVNIPGYELIGDLLKSNDSGMKPIIAALTARPSRYTNYEGVRINYQKKRTKIWLADNGFRIDELHMAGNFKKKLNRFADIVIEHMDERKIYYLENDEYLAYAAKERCPMTHIYLVTYHGYHEIQYHI